MNTNVSSRTTAAAAGNAESIANSTSAHYRDVVDGGEQFSAHQSTSPLRDELHKLKNDLETLLARGSSLSESELCGARDRLYTAFDSVRSSTKEKLSSIQASAKDLASKAGEKANEAKQHLSQGVDSTVEYMKKRPLQSVAIATGVGFLLGMLLRRDRGED
jgi:ElaB/YqjD/DUF883 family membrane-anchored ribosome-binding protein